MNELRKLLIVDDDLHLRALVKTYAEIEGFVCTETENCAQAIQLVENTDFDIIILDVMMPGIDGFKGLAEIRQYTEAPVIMLSARTEEYDKLLGFNLGADDYVSKPFSPKELMARIRAVLKRSNTSNSSGVTFGNLHINEKSHSVAVDSIPIVLTPKEFDLLIYLSKNHQIVLDRETILKNVWGYNYYGDTRTVDTHIKSLRDRLGSCRDLITTVWGVGYKFEYIEENIHKEIP